MNTSVILSMSNFHISDQQWPGISGWQVTHQCHPISNERFIHLENGAEVPAVFFDLQN